MGWFDEQIKQRMKNDMDNFAEACADLSGVIMGKGSHDESLINDEKRTKDAIDEILRYYHVKPRELPEKLKDMNEQLEYLLRPSGIMRRSVKLTGKWYKDGIGALLGKTADGKAVALIPAGLTGYEFYDHEKGSRIRVNSKTAGMLSEEAICFYRPLPLKSLGIKDLMLFIIRTLSVPDFIMVGLASQAATLMGMFLPYINNVIFDKVVPAGEMKLLIPITCLFLGVTVSTALIGITKSLVMARLQTKLNIAVQAASMMRVLSLPAPFFKKYAAGELSARTQQINGLCNMLTNAILTTGISSLFSLAYITQIFNYAPSLVVPALIIIIVTLLFSLLSTFLQMKISKRMMESDVKRRGLEYSLISGVQKLKLAGAERRAFAKWAAWYKDTAKLRYDPPAIIKLNSVISTAITLAGTIALYYFAAISEISIADYMAFNVSYGMISGAFMSLTGIALTIANIKPVMDMVKPILNEVPEISEGKEMVTRLTGSIELNNVSFRYNSDMPYVIDNMSLKIRPGQYIAIVGQTGCGKSTLMRLMLGFEKPDKGAIYYDGKDIASLDLKSLRRNIGVVMQDGKLFQGDIYSNIVISAPGLTMDEAWEAAELAGIAEDIRNMPMGMHTLISEGSGGISGGQRQRLMIARAIASKPRILMFDEATSALDNLAQKIVSDSLEKLKCTRIVIAHRLSTIKQCDRIIVLDQGRIIEDGKYEELLERNGFFAELVARQRLDAQ